MNPCILRKAALAAAFAALVQTPAQALQQQAGAGPGSEAEIARRATGIDASGDYRSELERCTSGGASQDRRSCMTEAASARAARARGELARPGEDYTANALARCRPFSGEDRVACEARVMGLGQTSGSVAGGGLLRSVETVVLPRGQETVTFSPKTQEPVVVVPPPRR